MTTCSRLARAMALALLLVSGAAAAPSMAQIPNFAPPAPATNKALVPSPANPQAGAGPEAAAPEGGAGLSGEQIDGLLRKLEDPQARSELIDTLKALRSTEARTTTATPAPAPAPEDLLGQVSSALNSRVGTAVDTLTGVARDLSNLPLLVDWLLYQASEGRRGYWLGVFQGLLWAGGAGFLAWLAVVSILRRRGEKAPLRAWAGPVRRSLAAAGKVLRDLSPIAAFVVAAAVVLQLQPMLPVSQHVGTLLLGGLALGRGLRVVNCHLMKPGRSAERPLPLADDTAAFLFRWGNRIGQTVIYSYFGLAAALRLGMPPSIHTVIGHVLFITVACLITSCILQAREAIALRVRRAAENLKGSLAGSAVPWDLLGGYLHLLAIGLVWIHYLVWAVGARGGFRWLFVATVATVGLMFLARLLLIMVDRSEERLTALQAGHEGDGEEPQRARSWSFALARIGIKLGVVFLLLEAWGLGLLDWLQTETGRLVMEKAMRMGLILLGAVVIWQVVGRMIGSYITATDTQGNIKYSNRSRTLANIARNVVLVLIVLFAGATVLTEIGIDTAPLLAGAGVVGLAIGFGAQTLVKDIITGLFILLGDTLRVGDVVDVGKSGVVEGMSMRTITLRDYGGSVHTIPYSSISIVTNMTKDFSFTVLNVGVAYREDVDRLMDVLREIDTQLRREWPYRRLILEPIDVAGVDALAESAVMVKARIKVRPGEQWRILREFNRRLKLRFDELGIEIPYPHRTLYYGGEKGSQMPPSFIEETRRELTGNDDMAGARHPGPATGVTRLNPAPGRA
ncbi:mechanosensitive ion channel [Geminicoccaceae bacterium 1502E]|nr:mechanosensitive ion channel [Geminicoccaceae bacterium 1502E]